MSKVDDSSPQKIREAFYAVLEIPGIHRHGEKVFNRLLKAPGHEMTRQALWAEFGAGPLSLWFGKLCKMVAAELGEPTPKPYALTDTVTVASGEKALRLKARVVEAISS